MRSNRLVIGAALVALVVGACQGTTSSPAASSAASVAAPSAAPSAAASASAAASQAAAASPTSPPADPAEAVIKNVEPGAKLTFWTFFLEPTFTQYLNDTVARFKATYPGVDVTIEDHKGTMRDELNTAFAAGNAPDVINLSVSEGWVSDYAGKGLLLGLDDTVPQDVQSIYFPGLWKEQLVDNKNYQFPWYQGLNVELINKGIYEKAGLTVDQFPKTIQELPALCKTILDKTSTVCTIRLTMSDLLAQMVYEGNVPVYNADKTAFTFNSQEGVDWLQMYVDMVTAGTVDNTVLTTTDDRVGLNAFSAGTSAFYATGPNLARVVKDTNQTLYNNLAMVPTPLGKSGVAGKGLMSISVNKSTKFPNASLALAQFFTNPVNMVAFSKQVAIYPSSAKAYDDPFFSTPTTAIEDAGRSLAKQTVSTYQDIVPFVVHKPDVNEILKKAIESALFNKVPAKQALDQAVADANKIIK